jgi:hypothetical protein
MCGMLRKLNLTDSGKLYKICATIILQVNKRAEIVHLWLKFEGANNEKAHYVEHGYFGWVL